MFHDIKSYFIDAIFASRIISFPTRIGCLILNEEMFPWQIVDNLDYVPHNHCSFSWHVCLLYFSGQFTPLFVSSKHFSSPLAFRFFSRMHFHRPCVYFQGISGTHLKRECNFHYLAKKIFPVKRMHNRFYVHKDQSMYRCSCIIISIFIIVAYSKNDFYGIGIENVTLWLIIFS